MARYTIGLALGAALVAAGANAQPFTSGDIAVSVVGSGTNPGGTDVFENVSIDEFSIQNGSATLKQTIALPSQDSGASHGIVSSYGSKSEGELTLSEDGHSVTYLGYDGTDNPAGTSNASHGGRRVVADITGDGNVDTTTSFSDGYVGDNPRSAVTRDGREFWTGGNASVDVTGGVRYLADGASSSVSVENSLKNTREVELVNGQLYASTKPKHGGPGIFAVGTGEPITGGQTLTPIIPGSVRFGGRSVDLDPFGFFFADPNTLYVADEGTPDSGNGLGGLQKWSDLNGHWTLDYDLTSGLGASTGLRGLAGSVSNGEVTLYGITAEPGETDPTKLVEFSDALSAATLTQSASFTTLLTSPQNYVFRGVALAPAPTPEPASWATLTLGALALLGLARRAKKSA